jgi:hypothetical protein
MTENLKQFERDGPQPRRKDVSSQGFVKGYLAAAILMSVIVEIQAVLVALRARSHHIALWHSEGFILVLVIMVPWAWAIIGYRRVRAANVSSGGSQEVLLALQYNGVMLLFWAYAVMMIISNAMSYLTNFTSG